MNFGMPVQIQGLLDLLMRSVREAIAFGLETRILKKGLRSTPFRLKNHLWS